ncbi:hypothetical protein PRIPAC_70814 [Pristionchus pacificus]|uniref:Uncharacterized protein n=1 Tax=Pristionchus pacificus TaxID=54126 RepID=A0A2A6BF18_PRIPA|nr:hypothetical protein PRIPAC_70814 [Pristionchus pacificus]|eukprot:PDM64477.1 hypothetical protein PRIPAC_52733 [Pristionchus pacificus]
MGPFQSKSSLSKCKFSIVSPLLIIFNKSLHSKSIPSLWKQAIVKPIPKTSSNSINTFRPISLTCSATKIFEKILISEITSYLDSHNLFDFNQAGFRINRSTCTQLLCIMSPSLLERSIRLMVHYSLFHPLSKTSALLCNPRLSSTTISLELSRKPERRLISDLLFLHRSIHGFYSYDHTNLFKLSPLGRNLRRSHPLRIGLPYALPKSHSTFATRIIDRWNVLPADFVNSSPIFFRSHLLSLPSISFTSDSLLRL